MTDAAAGMDWVRHPLGGSRRARLLLVLAGIGLAANVGFAAYAVSQPSDGWKLQPRPEGLVFSGLRTVAAPAASSLRQGDVLLAVDGHGVGDLLAQAMRGDGTPPSGWRVGGVVAYRVLRDGAE